MTIVSLCKCVSPQWARIHNGQCQSFLGRVPTRWSALWNVLLPPPSVTQITDRCLPLVRVELRILRWNFHILFWAKTGDRRSSQSALWNLVVRPIRSTGFRDIWDLRTPSVYCTAQHFWWKSWDRTTTRLYRESQQLPFLTVSEDFLLIIVFYKGEKTDVLLFSCSFEIRGAYKLTSCSYKAETQVTF